MADDLVHWLPPVPARFKAACGEDLDPPDACERSYTAGQLAIMNGEVTCPACRAALTVRTLEATDG